MSYYCKAYKAVADSESNNFSWSQNQQILSVDDNTLQDAFTLSASRRSNVCTASDTSA